MKYVYWILATMVGLAALLGILQTVASERVEVVQLHTVDAAGEAVTTRLWVVDDEGFQYLRVGLDGSGWFSRIQANGEFGVTRDGDTGRFTAVLRTDKSDRINELMRQKYTWGDTLIGTLIGGRENSVPIELHPAI